MGSPPFVYENVLYIPSAFVSWTGDALDQKTPLLRSNRAVNREVWFDHNLRWTYVELPTP